MENKKLQVAGWLSNQVAIQRTAGKTVELGGVGYRNIGICGYIQLSAGCFTDMVETLEIKTVAERPSYGNTIEKSFMWEGMEVMALFGKEDE
jgi:hypothetical protein